MKEEATTRTSMRGAIGRPASTRSSLESDPAIFTAAGTDFLGMLGHDLRAPLNGLMGFLAMLEDTELDANQRSCLSTAMLCGADLLETLNGILEGVKADTGHILLNEEWNDLREVLSCIAAVFRPQAALHEIRFEWEVNASVPRWWYFDRCKLRQILSNLLSNSLKFTSHGVVGLAVETISEEANAVTQLQITVQDTGIGIPEEKLEGLFEPFRQGSPTEKKSMIGSGLGLAIVRRLVQLHSGDVIVRSRASHGTEVKLRFSWPHSHEPAAIPA